MNTPAWEELARTFDPSAVASLRRLFEREGSFSVTAAELHAASGGSIAETRRLLESLANAGVLAKQMIVTCGNCGGVLQADDVESNTCSCGALLDDAGTITEASYGLQRAPIRDVSWLFVLHGMNTEGTWQEELAALIARTYSHRVPVSIYKYGIIRPGVLFRWRQSQLVDEVAAKLRCFINQSRQLDNVRDRPDVIAHSFGTWLVAEVLRRHDDLKIGRLILLGCVIRPDFDWKLLFDRGQVEGVLNHCATHDSVVPAAQYFVPDTGPAGRHGFDSSLAPNIAAPNLGHSDYFDRERLPLIYRRVWEPFLVRAENPLRGIENLFTPQMPWRPKPWLIRAITRAIAVGVCVPIYSLLPQLIVEGIPYLMSISGRAKK